MKWEVQPTTCQDKVTGHLVIAKDANERFPDADITIEIHNAGPLLTADLANRVCKLLNVDFTQHVLGPWARD